MTNSRLVPCPKPQAPVRLYEKQLPLSSFGTTVERYTTARKTLFEKHITANGVEQWFHVVPNRVKEE